MGLIQGFKGMILPTGVSLSASTASIGSGVEYQLEAYITPELASNNKIHWSASNNNVTVDENGLVTGVTDGTSVVTATTDYGGYTASCTFTIFTIPVTGVSLDTNKLTLTPGDTYQLTATITPNNATNKNVTWRSTDTSVVVVDNNGLVTCIANGDAEIIVTTVDGNYTATCEVTTKKPDYDMYYDFRGGSLAGFKAAGGTGIYTDGSYTIDSGGLGQTGSANDRNTHAYVTGLDFTNATFAYIERLGYWYSGARSNGKGMGYGTSYNGKNGFNGPGVWGRINLNTSSPGTYSTNGINYYPNDPVTSYQKYAASGGETTEHLEIDFVNNVCKYVLTGANNKTFTINLTEELKNNLFGMTGVGWNWGRGYSSYNSERIRRVKIHIEY